jgi:hypothetical protein
MSLWWIKVVSVIDKWFLLHLWNIGFKLLAFCSVTLCAHINIISKYQFRNWLSKQKRFSHVSALIIAGIIVILRPSVPSFMLLSRQD